MASYEELKEQIRKLQEQAEEARRTEIESVVADIKAKIAAYGLTVKDLGFSGAVRKTASGRSEVAPKYKLNDQTWSGRGRQPKWVADHIAAGGTLEDLAI